jgi:hypothetical protein
MMIPQFEVDVRVQYWDAAARQKVDERTTGFEASPQIRLR